VTISQKSLRSQVLAGNHYFMHFCGNPGSKVATGVRVGPAGIQIPDPQIPSQMP